MNIKVIQTNTYKLELWLIGLLEKIMYLMNYFLITNNSPLNPAKFIISIKFHNYSNKIT